MHEAEDGRKTQKTRKSRERRRSRKKMDGTTTDGQMMDVRTDGDDVVGEAENLLLLHKCRALQSRGRRRWLLARNVRFL